MAKRVSFTQSNPGWAKAMATRVREMANKEVAAGFPRGTKAGSETYDNGASVLDVAIWNQFGAEIDHPGGTAYRKEMTNSGSYAMGDAEYKVRFVKNSDKRANELKRTKAHKIKIPARPFMDEAVNIIELDKDGSVAYIAKQVISGNMTASQALKQTGQLAETAIREAINDSSLYEPNAPSTKQKKRSDKPLIDTGKMRQAVTSIVREKS